MPATPSCPKCQNTSFEIVPLKVKNANFQKNAIVCSICGCIVSVEEKMNVAYMLNKLAEAQGIRF